MIRALLARLPGPLSPLGWLIAGVALVIGLALLAGAWAQLWSWWPWSAERRADRAEAALEAAKDRAAVNEAITKAERQAAPVMIETRTVVAAATASARSAPDATTPLDPDRAERLRDADRRLCDLAVVACRPVGDG